MRLRSWVVLATGLAFLAGTGLGAILGHFVPAPPSGGGSGVVEEDVDRYMRHFDRQIGVRDDEQRAAIRIAYERYHAGIRVLRDEFLRANRERVEEVKTDFDAHVRDVLDDEQEREWNRLTRAVGARSGARDRDDGGGARREGE